jgi:hypothetical protein
MLFEFCLTDDDLRALGVWRSSNADLGPAPRTQGIGMLLAMIQREPTCARWVQDLLDLRHLERVLEIRRGGLPEAHANWCDWSRHGTGTDLPGLAWALSTDSRCEIRDLGARLCRDAVTRACRAFVSTSSTDTAGHTAGTG